jgi:hypothetical protein
MTSARQSPELQAGECDDMTILLGAMLETVGHPFRLVIVGLNPFRPELFSHFNLEVYFKGKSISMDATMPSHMGRVPQHSSRKGSV